MPVIEDSARLVDDVVNGKLVWVVKCISGARYFIEVKETPGVSKYMPPTVKYSTLGKSFGTLQDAVGAISEKYKVFVR